MTANGQREKSQNNPLMHKCLEDRGVSRLFVISKFYVAVIWTSEQLSLVVLRAWRYLLWIDGSSNLYSVCGRVKAYIYTHKASQWNMQMTVINWTQRRWKMTICWNWACQYISGELLILFINKSLTWKTMEWKRHLRS